jgi:hypothetical protein
MCPFVRALVAFSTIAEFRTPSDVAERGLGFRAGGPDALIGRPGPYVA